MALTGITEYLYKAKQGKYAIPLFDVFEMQSAKGVFKAVAEKNSPAIIAIYAQMVLLPDAEAFTHYLKTMAKQVEAPVSIMLDHGASVEQCTKAIEFGFTDVMIDGSSQPNDENVKMTKQVVEMAHKKGVGVEAELGHVGSVDNYDEFGGQSQGFTNPDSVQPFINATGVDFLAVAFGTAHGVMKKTPNLNLDLLADIASRVDIPLVMHGGSGLTNEQFKQAIATGIAKINVSTNLVISATKMMREAAAEDDANIFKIMNAACEAYKVGCGKVFDLFGSTGKGGAV